MFTVLKILSDTVSILATGPASALAFLGRAFRLLARAAKNRHDAALLASLDDRMLSDIGLTRSDLRDAYAEPLWRDPTSVLANRAAERRANRRRFVFGMTRAPMSPSIVPDKGFKRPVTHRPARYAL
ncbi:MAG: DUF1127 domain-containing protein [Rhizobiales bacterium]|nr:DUF1127 domain-containing protein [Hyphomicrobiales bacterium]